MSNIRNFINNLKEAGGFKAKLRNRLFSALIDGFEAVDADLNEKQEQINNICKDLSAIQASLDQMNALFATHGAVIEDNRRGVAFLKDELDNISVNLRNNNAALEKLSADDEFLKLKLSGIEKKLKNAPAAVQTVQQSETAAAPVTVKAENNGSDYESIDYFDFENHFRGSIDSIKKAQAFYLKYFKDKKNVIDIGCGRGEFLSLMQDNGINACGVDIYEPYADYCNMKGLKATCGDGSEYLAKQENVDGIFVGQVVEHLQPHEIIRLCNTAYEKLTDGGCIILETPNPTSLAIYTNAFYIDPSHIKPVHPLTMKYYLEKAGFRSIEIIYTDASRPPYEIPELKIAGGENTEEFNKAMKQVSELLYGSQDYAVVAVK